MIVATCLKELFKGKTINVDGKDISLQYHYGDQKELNRWVANKTLYKKQKYPLIWYILNDVTPISNQGLKTKTQIIIFNLSKCEYMNTDRYDKVYLKYIDPTYQLINDILFSNTNIRLNSRNNLPYKDEPFFGVATDNPNTQYADFKSQNKKGTKNITTDIVDARVIEIEIEIYPECIIK